jgi:hypothetical protein
VFFENDVPFARNDVPFAPSDTPFAPSDMSFIPAGVSFAPNIMRETGMNLPETAENTPFTAPNTAGGQTATAIPADGGRDAGSGNGMGTDPFTCGVNNAPPVISDAPPPRASGAAGLLAFVAWTCGHPKRTPLTKPGKTPNLAHEIPVSICGTTVQRDLSGAIVAAGRRNWPSPSWPTIARMTTGR